MKKRSFQTVQRVVAVITTSALLFNVVGCGFHKSKPSYSSFLEDEAGDDAGGDESDSGSESESPHIKDFSELEDGKPVTRSSTETTDGKNKSIVFTIDSANANGKVEAPQSGVTDHSPEPVSQGTSPSVEGSPFAGDGKSASSFANGAPQVGGGRHAGEGGSDGRGVSSKPEGRHVYPSVKEFEIEVQKDRELIEAELGKTNTASQGKKKEAEEAVAAAVQTHNAEVDNSLAAVPGWDALVSASAQPSGFKTTSSSPTGQALRNARQSAQYTKVTVPGAPSDLLNMAEQTLAAADNAAANGNLNDAEARRLAATDLINAARCPSCLPQSPEKGSYEIQATTSERSEKSKSYAASKDLYNAANDLDKNGFPGFANDARTAAGRLLNIALGLARVATIVDLPLNILEAFAQKTVAFDESGSPQIVEASGIEIAFALGTLAFVAAGAVTVGWQAAIGAGIIAGLGKTVEKGMVKHVAEKAALEIAEKGAVGAEKEAIEQAAKEAAEAEAKSSVETAGKAADQIAASVTKEISDFAHSISKETINWSEHSLDRLTERGITKEQAEKVLEVGTKFYDELTKSVVVFADKAIVTGSAGSTKLIGLAIATDTRTVKTVLREGRILEKLPLRFKVIQ